MESKEELMKLTKDQLTDKIIELSLSGGGAGGGLAAEQEAHAATKEKLEEALEEIEALKIVNETVDQSSPSSEVSPQSGGRKGGLGDGELSEKARTFTADQKQKRGGVKKVTAVLGPVKGIRIDKKKHTAEAFMASKELQQKAVDMNHPLIIIKN